MTVAKNLISEWNSNLRDGEKPYPNSNRFILALGILIYNVRNNIKFETFTSEESYLSPDPLCFAWGACLGEKS